MKPAGGSPWRSSPARVRDVVKTDWELSRDGDRAVITRYQTPLGLWLLDRWFRIPDAVFDRIEWWFPRTSPLTRVPCLLYSRWLPQLIMRRDWTDYDVEERPEVIDGDRADDQPEDADALRDGVRPDEKDVG